MVHPKWGKFIDMLIHTFIGWLIEAKEPQDDVCLIKVDSPFHFSDAVGLAPLPKPFEEPPVNSN